MQLLIENDDLKEAVIEWLSRKGHSVSADGEFVIYDVDNECEVDNAQVRVELV